MIDLIKNQVDTGFLKYAAGTAITCPGCGEVMDWRRTVVATVYASKAGQERITAQYTQCSKCWDARKANLDAGMAKAQAKLNAAGHGITLRAEICDGRELSKSKPAPKSKPADLQARALEACENGDYVGFCLACGNEQEQCEPDGRRRKCEACGEFKVYGAEEIILMGGRE
jgi:hypothetical protein